MSALLLFTLLSAGPRIVAPGERVQTTRAEVRLYAMAEGRVLTLKVDGVPAGTCRRGTPVHCLAPVPPGDHTVTLSDGAGTVTWQITRYVTTGRLPQDVDLQGFGNAPIHTREIEQVCASCHPMDDVDGGTRDTSMLGAPCMACHRDVTLRKFEHGPVGQGMCLRCHDPASTPRYAVEWPIRDTCFHCHADIKATFNDKAFRHGPPAQGRCTTCHDPHGSDNPRWLKLPPFELCTNCHTEKKSDRHVVQGFVYGDSHPVKDRPHPLRPGETFSCPSCHNPHAANSRFLWQYDVTTREALCRTCHQK